MNIRILSISCICLLLTLCCGVTYAQKAKSSLSGIVKTNDGTAADNVTVSVKTVSIQTDESGRFIFRNLMPGVYQLRISGIGIKPVSMDVQVKEGGNEMNTITISESSSQLNEITVKAYRSSNEKPATLGKVAIPPRDLPQSVQIISTQVIQDQQADRLGDVMKNVNGVALGANRGGVGENFYARGYSLGSNNIFKNGARTSIGGSPEASTLESVEVLKGSAALLYGGVTGGAVVNMITKKPKFEHGGEVAFRTGSYGQYKPTVDVYGPIDDKFAFRIIGTGEKAGSFRDHVESKRFYINPSILYRASEKTDVLFQADYLSSNYTPDFGVGSVNSQIVDFGREKFLNTPWAYNKTNTTTLQLNANHHFNDDWKINAVAAYQSYDRNYYGAERIQANTAGIAARNLTRAKTQEYTYNQQVNLTGHFQFLGIKNTLLVGVDADQSRVTSNAFNFRNQAGQLVSTFNYGNMNVFDPSTYLGNGYMPEAVAISRTLTPVYRYGAFIQNLFELTSKFKVLAGIRYTDQKNARTNAIALATGKPTLGATKFDDAFSPKFGLIYQPFKQTSAYVSYANNFIANTGTDIYFQALPPSTVDQFEAGIKNDFLGGKLSANVTYYKIINNNIAQTAELDVNGVPNSNTNIKQLNGQTTSDGLEVDLSGAILPGLNFLAGYSYNFMRYTKTAPITSHTVPAPTAANPNATTTIVLAGMIEDVRLVGTTKHTANATLFYTVQSGKIKGLKLGASAFYTGDRNGGWNDNKAATTLRLIPLKAFTTIDLSAGYSWRRISLLGKVSNITNELSYFVHENYSVNPIPPRQFLTTVSYKF
ncbi:TonB-dependent siderophore receptor [Pedobacter sp.]|uniref:TonB-dependent siderophore receptor n=1 Tax=Pedobacter sp. TaxID=1411316 RepID=UPI0031DEE306